MDLNQKSSTIFDRIAILQPLKIRDFRFFWSGLAISLLGDGIYLVAIAWQVLTIDNSPSALAYVIAAWMVPQVILLLGGGVLADKFDRRKLMISADVIRVCALGGLAILSLSGVIEIWHMVLLAALYGVGDALFAPAFGAYVPQLVPENQLVEANSLDYVIRPLAMYSLGPAIGGQLVRIGPGVAFAVDAATFAISAACLLVIRTSGKPPPSASLTVKRAIRELGEGFSFVRSQSWLWTSLLAGAIALFFYWGPLEVLVPYLAKNELKAGASGYGLVLASGGVGGAIAAVIISTIGFPRRFMTFMFLAWGLGCGAIGFVAVATQSWHAMIVLFVSEAGVTAGAIVWATVLQRHVPDKLRGRVTSFDWFVSVALMPASFIFVGPIAKAIGARETLVAGGILAGSAALMLLVLPGARSIERQSIRRPTLETQEPPFPV